MNHYLITRFNVRSKDWHHTRRGAPVQTDEWLHDRFKIFEKYCLPSVAQQSNPHFTWCVFFDSETPVSYKKRIDKIIERQKNIVAFYIENMEFLNPTMIS